MAVETTQVESLIGFALPPSNLEAGARTLAAELRLYGDINR
jgi:hypothetical protein